ncbi:MAG: transposase [Xenococcus sp. (in: cyanobacteria)]
MKILGLDIGRGSAVACLLDSFPVNIQQHYKKLKRNKEFYKLTTDSKGLKNFLELKPDAIVLEPTGHWYSHFWVSVANKNDIQIYWVGHSDLDKQRGSYGFTNKRDEEDALCLAASYFDERFIDEQGNQRFLNYYYSQNEAIIKIRETFLEKEQLAKLRTGLIAQLRQRLAYEFPEIVKHRLEISKFRGFTPIIGWLAGSHQAQRYANQYAQSVVHELGIEFSDFTRSHCQMIVEIETRITQCYDYLEEALKNPDFEQYIQVFDKFGFGLDNKALLLYQIYPFEKFLVNNKAWIEYDESKGKLQKRDRSLRKFQAFMGMSFSYEQSVDKVKRKFHGSTMTLSHLYDWASCMVAPKKHGSRIEGEIGKTLCDRFQELRVNVKGKDSLTRIVFKATRMLFYDLLNELQQ